MRDRRWLLLFFCCPWSSDAFAPNQPAPPKKKTTELAAAQELTIVEGLIATGLAAGALTAAGRKWKMDLQDIVSSG